MINYYMMNNLFYLWQKLQHFFSNERLEIEIKIKKISISLDKYYNYVFGYRMFHFK